MSLSIPPGALDRLQHLRQTRKFTTEKFYPGAPTEEIRAACEQRVNDFLQDIIGLLQSGTKAGDLFARARALTGTFVHQDTEERERVDDYIGESMRIIGLDDWTQHVP